MRRIHRLFFLAALLTLAIAVYYGGLQGSFLFDDYANLPALGAMGPIRDGASFWRYVTSGTADPAGRPLSLLSFLLDARDWPAAAAPFKRTNLALHLINGVLLFALLRRLGKEAPAYSRYPARFDLAACLASSLWLLHPLLVSTTLYVVQREAMLPTSFTLLGLLLWLRGRCAFGEGRHAAGWLWLVAGLGLSTALAMLSKANGILLPALALTIETFYLSPSDRREWLRPRRRSYGFSMGLLALLPTLFLAGYLLYEGWHGWVHGTSSARPWTLGQRLLTEPRVLMEYLKLLWLPRPFTTGLFNDQYPVSTSLWSPLTTLPAMIAIVALVAAAWRLRHRAPAIALAIAFYLVGQSIESSTLALELYFEHRNYLPAMAMFWPLALLLSGAPVWTRQGAPRADPQWLDVRVRAVVGAIIVGGLAWMTHARADLWGDTRDQALLWGKLNPQSPRAQAYAAHAEMQAGHPDLAAARLRRALATKPDEVQLALNLLAAECRGGRVEDATLTAARRALRTTHDTGSLLASWFGRAIDQSASPACPQMTLAAIGGLLDAARANPRLTDMPGRRQDLLYLRGRIALRQRQPEAALSDFDAALDQQVRATTAFQQAALLGSAGYPDRGLAHLDHYVAVRAKETSPAFGMPLLHFWVLQRQHYWDRELVRLRKTLREDAANRPTGSA